MDVVKIDEGLWQWSSAHPDWREGSDWDRQVWSTYFEAADAIVVIDPLVPEEATEGERFWRAFDRDVQRRDLPVAVLLTCAWHARSSDAFAQRHGATVWAPDPSAVTLDSPVHALGDGDRSVGGVLVCDSGAPAPNREVAYRLDRRVLVVGDLIAAVDGRLTIAPAEWYRETAATRSWHESHSRSAVRRLLEPAPATVLCAHGRVDSPNAVAQLRRQVAE